MYHGFTPTEIDAMPWRTVQEFLACLPALRQQEATAMFGETT